MNNIFSSRVFLGRSFAVVLAIAAVLLFAGVVYAGVAVSVGPDFPSPIIVGTNNVPISMDIVNNSTSGDGNPLTLNSIKLIPSCGAISGSNCTSLDPGVFTVSATGTGAGSCAANTFTIAVTDVPSGEVTFTPNAAIALTPGQTCTINFTVDVIGAPDVDATGAPGIQTLQLGSVAGTDQLQQPGTGSGSDTTTIDKADPIVTTNIHDGSHVATTSAAVGTEVHDNASVTGSGPTPTGTVGFNLYTNPQCDSATTTAIVALSSGSAESGTTTLGSGGLGYRAFYAGDANYNSAMGACEPLNATKLTPSVTTNIHDGSHVATTSAAIGTQVHDNASVTGSGPTPTGTVGFNLYTNPQCDSATTTAIVALSSGSAESGTTTLAAGGLGYRAFYGGDTNYTSAMGVCEPLTASKLSPSIATTLSSTTVNTGASVHDSATLSGATSDAGGTVTYTVYTNSSCSAGAMDAGTKAVTNGTVTDSNSLVFNSAGTFYWQAVYSGDAKNNGASSPCQSEILVVNQPAGQYCSPGYWKQSQHFDSWVGYTQGQSFASVFGRTITIMWSDKGKPQPVTNPTLLQALQANGGGISMFARVSVDGLLNASALSSGLTTAQVITIVQNAIDSGNYQAAATQLTAPENCPLN